MWCSDPFLSCLKAFGYSVVRFPTADLEPMELLLRTGRALERLGGLTALLVPGPHVRLPRMTRDRPASSLSGRRTGTLDAGVGLTLLGAVLAGMGCSEIGLGGTYRSARSMVFEFDNVTEDSVAVVDLDQYLADARVNPRSSRVAALLEADDLYVTTSVVKSRALTVEARDEDGAGLAIALPEIEQVAGGRVEIRHAGGAASNLVYSGPVPLAFGFRALRLFYDDGRYRAFAPLPPGQAALARREPSPEWLEVDSPLVRLG